MANLRSKDLNLLNVFGALWDEKNLSKAAKRLALSQPAMSHALARLRREFDDELFVRSGKGMTPTPRAIALKDDLKAILLQMQKLYESSAAMDPARFEGRVTIATTDYLEHLLLPNFLPLLKTKAPGLTLVVRATSGTLNKTELEHGTLDMAIAGFFGPLPEGFHSKEILSETYLSIIRKGHPLVDDQLTLKDFLKLDHVLVSPQGDLDGALDQALAKKGLKRRVVVGVSNFHTPGAIIAKTDCIATLPSRMARDHAELYGLHTFEPPLSVPGFKLKLVWHERTERDPMLVWVRSQIAATMKSLS